MSAATNPQSSKHSSKLKQQVVNIFRKQTHNIRHSRVALSLIPGKPMREWQADDAAEAGHLFVVQTLHEQGRCCTQNAANLACKNGHIEMVRLLRAQDIHCTARSDERRVGQGWVGMARPRWSPYT